MDKLPSMSLSPRDVSRLQENRRKAASKLSKVEIEANTIVAHAITTTKCCFCMNNLKLQEERYEKLKNLNNELVQKVLHEIYHEGKCCSRHIDDLVNALLNAKVTEFSYLSLWERCDERDQRSTGYDNFEYLCLKCPGLEKLEKLRIFKDHWHMLKPKYNKNFVSDVVQLFKNLTLLDLGGFACSLEDLWLVQKNLNKLEHLEVSVAFVQIEIADPLAGMPNLKRLHLLLDIYNSSYRDKSNDINFVDVLVQCVGRIKSLETYYFKKDFSWEEDRDFVNKYSAQFPQKKLHVDGIFLNEIGLSYPWPNFLTCDRIQLQDFEENLDAQQSFAHISFPVKHLAFIHCSANCIRQLLEILGQNIKHLKIENGGSALPLHRIMAKCPKLVSLELIFIDVARFVAKFSNVEGFNFKAEHFSKLQNLSLVNNHEMPSDSGTIDYYTALLLNAKNVAQLHVDYVVFSKAALQAMSEDEHCFEKVQKLHVSTFYDVELEESLLVFVLAKKMMLRSPVLKEIGIFTHFYSSKERYQYDEKIVRKYVKKLEALARELGIKVTHDTEDGC